MSGVFAQQLSLSDPPQPSVIMAATDWVSATLFGPLATSIAIIAIALLGFAMLGGRIPIRRAAYAIIGCFLLFGAKGIADGLRSATQGQTPPILAAAPPPPAFTPPPPTNSGAYDPYAGASVLRHGE